MQVYSINGVYINFKRNTSGIYMTKKPSQDVLVKAPADEHLAIFPFVTRKKLNSLQLKESLSDKESALNNNENERLISNCMIENLEGFDNCNARLLHSKIKSASKFSKVHIADKSIIDRVKNTSYTNIKGSKAGKIHSAAIKAGQDSKIDDIESFSTLADGTNININRIKTNILLSAGENNPENIIINDADVTASNIVEDLSNVDLTDEAIYRTHLCKESGSARIKNTKVKKLKCISLHANNSKIGSLTLTSDDTSHILNSKIEELRVSDGNIFLKNSKIKKLILPSGSKQVYIIKDDNSTIKNIVIKDKDSAVILKSFEIDSPEQIIKATK